MNDHFGNALHNRKVVSENWKDVPGPGDKHLRVALVDALLALVVEVRELRATILEATDPQRAEKEAQKAADQAKQHAENDARHEERQRWAKVAAETEIVKRWEAYVKQQPERPRVTESIRRALTTYGGKEICQMSVADFITEVHKPNGGELRHYRHMGSVAIQTLRAAFPPEGTP